ncbi:MAG: hypothetical protein G01um101429_230 [Parcubacteria group bacterium Gr01-1014_29]|nr:MAG: hypothetical protein G01um101429_230 [Parcubacteria group bacterium Gr01-1014_29]
MIQLSEREQGVLEAIVRDYITSAIPVSSERVRKVSDIDISSATFRAIMGDLEDTGYLTQPYTSAGRIPTQRAYRYFVDNCINKNNSPDEVFVRLFQELGGWNLCMRKITARAHVFAAVLDDDEVTHFGAKEIFKEPEFLNDPLLMRSFGSLIDSLHDLLYEYREATRDTSEPRAFIERENPVRAARRMSIVASPLREKRGVVIVLGPSRMNYEVVITTLRSL